MSAVQQVKDSVVPTYIEFDPGKWFYGIGALVVFLLLLIVVTRFNLDR
ncbi:MAG TPA: hypothetical protein VFL59_08620 [Candidatus Nanopelagicales bacterium]|nr:hypothetical protein [Candidatus Nanopelagicales bacterium]